MSGYNTKQRRALLAFLGEHPDELLTARQMADALAEKQISLSAVYRNLAQLEAEEKVRRSAKSGSHEAFYQYLDAKGCKGTLHMSCVKCGKTARAYPKMDRLRPCKNPVFNSKALP